MTAPLVEICVDDVAGALAAEAEGADRIELCSAMSEGGLTPSIGLVQAVLGRVRRIGVRIMIRPRGGNYVFSAEEVEVMIADIAAFRALPKAPGVAVGFVCGALTASGVIDARTIARLKVACGGAPMTFHKAFDVTRDLGAALDTLLGLGIRSVLTSGGSPTAEGGAETLEILVGRSGRPGDDHCRRRGCGPRTCARCWRAPMCPRCICGPCAPMLSAVR